MKAFDPKYKFFHPGKYPNINDQHDLFRHLMAYKNRTYINTSDVKAISAAIFGVPIDVLRIDSANWRYPHEHPPEMTAQSKNSISVIFSLTHVLRERIRIHTIGEDLGLKQKVRIAKRWLMDNWNDERTETDTITDLMTRFVLVCSSLGAYMDDMILCIANNPDMKRLDKDSEFLIVFLTHAIEFANNSWGKNCTMIEYILYSLDEITWLKKRAAKGEKNMPDNNEPDYSEDLIYLAISRAMEGTDKFAALGRYKEKEIADGVAERIEPIINEKYNFGVHISVSVEEEDNQFYVVARIKENAECGGELDKYCEKCGTFHFDTKGLNGAEIERKKKEIYVEYYKSIRDKGKNSEE